MWQVVGAIIFQPINRGLPLRCLEEKYGLSSHHLEQERRSQKRLSLNINGHAHDNTHTVHENNRGSQLRFVDDVTHTPMNKHGEQLLGLMYDAKLL